MAENMENNADISNVDEPCTENICQVRRTVRMLDLAAARVSYALHAGNESVNTLIHSFTNMTKQVESMQKRIESLPDDDTKANLLKSCHEAVSTVQETTIAFQFYDRLNQRMQHISSSLNELSELIESPERMPEPSEWLGLENKIRSHYTLDNDLNMFDAVLAGEDIEDILTKANGDIEENDKIELF